MSNNRQVNQFTSAYSSAMTWEDNTLPLDTDSQHPHNQVVGEQLFLATDFVHQCLCPWYPTRTQPIQHTPTLVSAQKLTGTATFIDYTIPWWWHQSSCSLQYKRKAKEKISNHHQQSKRHKMIITLGSRNKKATIRIGYCRHLKSIWISQIGVRRRNRENKTGWSFDIRHDHGSNSSLDIWRLVTNGNLGEAREVHERDV